MASSSSGQIWTGAGWIPADSIAATNFKTPPKSPPNAPAPPPPATLAPTPAAVKAPTPTLSPVQPVSAPAAKPVQASPATPATVNYRNLASSVAGSINAQMGGAEYVEDTSGEGYDILRINPNVTVTPGMKSEIEKDLEKGVKIFSGVSVEKISDTEYRISPKASPSTSPTVTSPLAAAVSAAPGPANVFAPDWESAMANKPSPRMAAPMFQTTVQQEAPQTLGTLVNRMIQEANVMNQIAGIPRQYDQITIPQGEATALTYSREAMAFNAGLSGINAALQAFGAPTTIHELPAWNDLNKTPTGFAGWVASADTGLDKTQVFWNTNPLFNNPFMKDAGNIIPYLKMLEWSSEIAPYTPMGRLTYGDVFKSADTLATNATPAFEREFLYKIGGQNIITDTLANFAGGGAATIAEAPRFAWEISTRSPISGAAYAAKSGSKTPIQDVLGFYGQQGWLLAGTAGAGIMTAVLNTAETGDIENITNPLARLAGGMFVMSVITDPKFTSDEMVYAKPGTIMVDSSGKLEVSRGEWMKLPTAEEQAAIEAKLASNPVEMELTEVQKAQVEDAMDASWNAARSARIHQMTTDSGMGDSRLSDAWTKAAAEAFPDARIAKLIPKLQTGPGAAYFNPDLTIEPVMGPISKLVETDEGEMIVSMQPSGATLFGNPQYILTASAASPMAVGEMGGSLGSLVSLASLASGTHLANANITMTTAALNRSMINTVTNTAVSAKILDAVRTASLTETGVATLITTKTSVLEKTSTATLTKTLTGVLTKTSVLTKTITNTPTLPPVVAQTKTEKKKHKGFSFPKLPSIRSRAKSTIRSDLISSDISTHKYGKATSPAPTADVFNRFAVGGVIPTVEMRKNRKKEAAPSLMKRIGKMFKRGKL